MAKRGKFYVVWEGVEPGVYDSWEEAQEQVTNYPGAKYKSFNTQEELLQPIATAHPIIWISLSTLSVDKQE